MRNLFALRPSGVLCVLRAVSLWELCIEKSQRFRGVIESLVTVVTIFILKLSINRRGPEGARLRERKVARMGTALMGAAQRGSPQLTTQVFQDYLYPVSNNRSFDNQIGD